MKYFDFTNLINKYSTTFFALIPGEGMYDEFGDWIIAEPTRIELHGAIISHRENKIFRSEGALTAQDKALYILEPLDNALQVAKIVHEGKVYSVGDSLVNSDYTGVWAYTLKYVSAFKETRPEYDITEEFDRFEDRLDGTLEDTEVKSTEYKLTIGSKKLEERLDGVLVDD